MLRVTPVYGSPSPSAGDPPSSSSSDDGPPDWLSSPSPSCTLVEYAGMRVLLNVGWDEGLVAPPKDGEDVMKSASAAGGGRSPAVAPNELPDADAVLVCDSTLGSLGGLPRYFGASSGGEGAGGRAGRTPRGLCGSGKSGRSNPPFLATYPTVKMGQMTMYDQHAGLSLDGCDPGYTLEDVDACFGPGGFETLKYSQTFYLPADGDGDEGGGNSNNPKGKKLGASSRTFGKLLAVTPHRSGRVSGGCYWVLRRLVDDTEIVLAPTYGVGRERHLAGSTLHRFGISADALVTCPGGPRGALGGLYRPGAGGTPPRLPPPSSSRSEADLIESVMTTLRRDGNVLLPVDASGRVLEILLILDRHWERNRLGGAYNLVWVGPMAHNTVEFARSQLEWMAAPLGAQFDGQRGHPLALRNVTVCSCYSEAESAVGDGNPSCVLASGTALDHGPARDLLLRWGSNPDNLVLLTDSTGCSPRGDVWSGGRARGGAGGPGEAEGAQGPGGPAAAAEDSAPGGGTEGGGDEEAGGAASLGPAVPPADVSRTSTASQLLSAWCSARSDGVEMPDVVRVDVMSPHRAPLGGNELRRFLAGEEEGRRARAAEEERRAMLREIELARGRLRLGDDGGGGDAAAGGGTAGTRAGGGPSRAVPSGAGSATSGRPKKKSRFDQSLFIKFSKPVHMTFDVREEAVGIGQPDSVARYGVGESVGNSGVLEDDYGISVVADKFVDIVTGVDPSRHGGAGRVGEEVARRGLGFAQTGGSRAGEARRGKNASGGPASEDDAGASSGAVVSDGDPDGDERALEVSDLSDGRGIVRGRNGRPPTKVSVVPRRMDVLAEVSYVPLEGRADARAARNTVRALRPRNLVVVGGAGAGAAAAGLFDALARGGEGGGGGGGDGGGRHAPRDGETACVPVGHAAYGARLVDAPYLTREEREAAAAAGGEEAAAADHVEPAESKVGECTVSLVDYVATGKKWAVDGSVVLAPRRRSGGKGGERPSLMLSTREVLLTDLRQELIALGMKAEYTALSGHSQLVVNGTVVVRKDNATGRFDVEGPLCQDFYAVRSTICRQYVTV